VEFKDPAAFRSEVWYSERTWKNLQTIQIRS
jgi:hypothetical protein